MPVDKSGTAILLKGLTKQRIVRHFGWDYAVWRWATRRFFVVETQALQARTARSDYLAVGADDILWFLKDGDRLAKHALLYVREAFSGQPDALIVYTDHDQLNRLQLRTHPHFKPDWNPDLFQSHDYISPAVFFRRSFLQSLPPELQALDEHTLQRILPYVDQRHIIHIPRILYHQKKPAAPEKIKPAALASFSVPTPLPLVSLIIPTRDRLDILKPCIESILKLTEYENYEILIVDNRSAQVETLNWLQAIQQEDTRVRVIVYADAFNYSAINNFAVRQARGSIIGLVNNDVEVISPGWLTAMVCHAIRPEIGCVGAKLYYPDGRIQHAGVILGSGGGSGHAHRYFPRDAAGYCGRLQQVQNFTAVTGACLLVRKALFEQVGGLNETELTIAWNDIDLCLKVRAAGLRNLWTPHAELYHHESVSRGRDRSPEQRQRYQAETAYMYRTWGAIMRRDPCYNPNLTVAREDFSLNFFPDPAAFTRCPADE